MSVDLFAAIACPGTSISAAQHVRLIDVQQAESGYEVLSIELAGAARELLAGRGVGSIGQQRGEVRLHPASATLRPRGGR